MSCVCDRHSELMWIVTRVVGIAFRSAGIVRRPCLAVEEKVDVVTTVNVSCRGDVMNMWLALPCVVIFFDVS